MKAGRSGGLPEPGSLLGYRLAVARNGLQAVEAAKAAPPDLVLLDVSMAETDGYETCTRLEADPATRDISVIFLTARVDTADVLRGFAVGGVDYVTKRQRATPANAADVDSLVSCP